MWWTVLAKNDCCSWSRAEVHSVGILELKFFIGRLGWLKKPKSSDAVTGIIFYWKFARIVRGLSFLSQLEYLQRDDVHKKSRSVEVEFRFLIFQHQRFEVRTQLVNGRTMSDGGVSSDQWSMQGQLHVFIIKG